MSTLCIMLTVGVVLACLGFIVWATIGVDP